MVGTVIKAFIEKIAAGGAGLARVDGKTVFIEGSAPGETVLCRVSEDHRSWSQAEITEIIEVSTDRVQPACGLYGKCGGCNMQHLTYAAQVAAKTAILKDTFARIGGFSPPEPLVFPAEPWKYRNRMQFHAVSGESEAVWGLKVRKNSEIIPIFDCPIADSGIQTVLQSQKVLAKAFNPDKAVGRFTVYARNGLFLSENGVKRGTTRILERDLALDASVFFQSNGTMLEYLIADLREISRNTDQSLALADLYCGVGTFSAFLQDSFPHIDLVEENKNALALARENLKQFPSAAFYAQRSEDWAKNALKARRYGLIIVDPPRQGLNPALARRLAAEGPAMLAYVSCDPATLARDSAILLKGAYQLQELRWYDFYPQTAHIESLALFIK